ncbi:MAG: hypothetical protein H0T88_08105 [Lysobacter sp.]|nr:hypothetical protein [Lysobacter sp.]
MRWLPMRRPRLQLPGVPLHLTHRGVNRVATFLDDDECAAYLQALALASSEREIAVHAYVLMGAEPRNTQANSR